MRACGSWGTGSPPSNCRWPIAVSSPWPTTRNISPMQTLSTSQRPVWRPPQGSDLRSLFVTQTEPSTSQQNGQPAKPEAPKIPVLGLEEGYAYFEGRIVPMSEAKVSIATHALQYGTACFEGIRGYWNTQLQQLYLLKLRENYQRMAHSCNVLRILPKESIDDLCRITVELVRKHGYRQDVYV